MRISHNYKNVCVSWENYVQLRKLGFAADSINDVIGRLLKNNGYRERENLLQSTSGLRPRELTATSAVTVGAVNEHVE